MEHKPESFHVDILRQALKEEGKNMIHSDASLLCSGGVVVRTHRLILGACSPLLKDALQSLPESDSEAVFFSVPDLDPEVAREFFKRVYNNDEEEIDENDYEDAVEILGIKTPEIYIPSVKVEYIHPPPDYEEGGGEEEEEIKGKPRKKGQTRKRSLVWQYFTPDESVADWNRCNNCFKSVSGKMKNTSTMIRHLKAHHPQLYKSFAAIKYGEEEDSYFNFSSDKKEESENKARLEDRFLKDSLLKTNMDREEMDAAMGLLNRKLREANVQNDRTCPECLKEFSGKRNMQNHWKSIHSGIKPFTCELCNISFARLDTFRAHAGSVHSTARPFLCSRCGKTFTRRNVRDMHERVHKQDRRYPCAVCEKSFFTNQQRTNHARIHDGERPFECDICGKKFTLMHQLKTHSRVHTGERPYACESCNKTFKYSASKNHHNCERKGEVSRSKLKKARIEMVDESVLQVIEVKDGDETVIQEAPTVLSESDQENVKQENVEIIYGDETDVYFAKDIEENDEDAMM